VHAGNAGVLLFKLVLWLAKIATSAREFKLWEKLLFIKLVDRRHKVKNWLQNLDSAYAVAITTTLLFLISGSLVLFSGHKLAADGGATRVSAVSFVTLLYLLSLLLNGIARCTFRALWLHWQSQRAHSVLYNTFILLGRQDPTLF